MCSGFYLQILKTLVFIIHIMREFGICSCLVSLFLRMGRRNRKDDILKILIGLCNRSAQIQINDHLQRNVILRKTVMMSGAYCYQVNCIRRFIFYSFLRTESEFILEKWQKGTKTISDLLTVGRRKFGSCSIICPFSLSFFADIYMDLKAHQGRTCSVSKQWKHMI